MLCITGLIQINLGIMVHFLCVNNHVICVTIWPQILSFVQVIKITAFFNGSNRLCKFNILVINSHKLHGSGQ